MPNGPSPTARALRALEILQSRPGTTAEELGTRLGVTERAARRYVGILREAGIPVEAARGPHGGYRLGRGTRLPPVVFTESEALVLVMAMLDGQPGATDDDLVARATDKLIQALPEGVRRPAASLREHASVAPHQDSARPHPATTGALVAAGAARRRVVVTYRSDAGNVWDAEVDPWAVVVRYGRWYLLCHSHRADAIRTYRVDRIKSVRETEQRFVLPEDLDPVLALEESLGTGWEFPTHVVFDAPLSEVAPWIRPPMGRLEASRDECVLVGSTSNPSMYAQEWLARVPFGFRVEGGPELRAAVATVATRLAEALTQDPNASARALRARHGADLALDRGVSVAGASPLNGQEPLVVEHSVRIAAPEDKDQAFATLELAFAADPVMRWFWPDPSDYRATFSRFAGAIAGAAFEQGTALWLDDGRAVALWLPPGVGVDDDALVSIMLESVKPDLFTDLSAFADLVGEHHPVVEHWYLPVTGVDPFVQGKGLGATLLQHALATCDLNGLPAYLEASTARSRLLYERFGFREIGEIQVGSSPRIWPMIRDPMAPS